jgi:hypothetical protein
MLAQDLKIALGCGKPASITEASPDFERLAEFSIGAGGVLGSEMKRAQLVLGPGNRGRVAQLVCSFERNVQRPH